MTKFLTVLLRIAVLVFACWPVFSLADEVTVTKVGHWGSGPYLDVVVVGNYAYAVAGITGIDIIDISNPASPTLVSQYDTSGSVMDVFVDGNFAYVVYGSDGLQIIDISNKASPTRVGGYDTDGYAGDVFVDGNFAYVAYGSDGLQIIDISHKAFPTRVSGYDTSGFASGVFVAGNFAYVAGGKALQIIDISNKASPTRVGGYDTDGYAGDVFVDGNFAYVSGSKGLQIIDISNKASPTRVGGYDTSKYAYDVFVDGNFAYVADEEAGLEIIDISNKVSPTRVGGYGTYGFPMGVFVDDNFAYVVYGIDGLQIIDISNKASPTLMGDYDRRVYDVFVDGNFAYVLDQSDGLLIIDISHKASTTRVGSYDTAGYAVFVDGNFAYVADGSDGLQIIDISDKASPTRVGGYDTSGYAYDVFVDGNFAYVADGSDGLQIIDISDKAYPTRMGEYKSGRAYDVFVDGNFAYMVDEDSGLQIIDISHKASPIRVGGYNTSEQFNDVFVDGNFAYVTSSYGLHIINISDKASPTQVGHYDTDTSWSYDQITSRAVEVFVDGNFAYVTMAKFYVYEHKWDFFLQIIDISNKTSPTLMAHYYSYNYSLIAQVWDVFVDGNYIYVADSNQLLILIFGSEPQITITPTSYQFGNLPNTNSQYTTNILVRSTGNANLEIEKVEITGEDNFFIFPWTDSCSQKIIKPYQSCEIIVALSLPTEQAGFKEAMLSIHSNAHNNNIVTIPISANVLDTLPSEEPSLAIDIVEILNNGVVIRVSGSLATWPGKYDWLKDAILKNSSGNLRGIIIDKRFHTIYEISGQAGTVIDNFGIALDFAIELKNSGEDIKEILISDDDNATKIEKLSAQITGLSARTLLKMPTGTFKGISAIVRYTKWINPVYWEDLALSYFLDQNPTFVQTIDIVDGWVEDIELSVDTYVDGEVVYHSLNIVSDKLAEMLYIATHGDENTPQYSSIEAATSHLNIEIPCAQVGQSVYEGELTLNPENSLFELAPNVREIEIAPSMRCGKFYEKTLYLPCVQSIDETYWGNFNLIENSSPTQFYLWEYGAAECTDSK